MFSHPPKGLAALVRMAPTIPALAAGMSAAGADKVAQIVAMDAETPVGWVVAQAAEVPVVEAPIGEAPVVILALVAGSAPAAMVRPM